MRAFTIVIRKIVLNISVHRRLMISILNHTKLKRILKGIDILKMLDCLFSMNVFMSAFLREMSIIPFCIIDCRVNEKRIVK